MSERWDFYHFDNQGRPAFAFVDLGIAADTPVPTHPVSACLYLQMRSPRYDGLSSNEEYDSLIEIEDSLSELSQDDMLYVGRITSDGRRDFYFYVRDPIRWDEAVPERMRLFSGYKYRIAHNSDPEWKVYLDFLHPDEEQRHSISNRHVCESLERHGDSLSEPREIDHWAYFGEGASRDEFIRRAAALGYAVRDAWRSDEDDGRHGVQVFREDVPAYDTIDDCTHPLIRLAQGLGGEYDGWESVVVKPD